MENKKEFNEAMELCTVETCDFCGMEFWMHPEAEDLGEDELRFCDNVCEHRYTIDYIK